MYHKLPKSNRGLTSGIIMGAVIQFQVLFIQLFTFAITDNKMMIAGLNVLYTLLTILAFRYVQKANCSLVRWVQVRGALMVASYFMALYSTPLVLIIVNILSSLGYFIVMTNWNANQFLFLSDYKSIRLTKLIITREIVLIFGRVIMLSIIAQVEEFKGMNYMGLIIFSMACVGLLLLVEKNQGKSVAEQNTHSGTEVSSLMPCCKNS